jgi:hypothetical protein
MLIAPVMLIWEPKPAVIGFVLELETVPPVMPKLPLIIVELPPLDAEEIAPELDELKLPPDIVIDGVSYTHPNAVAAAMLLALDNEIPPELIVVPVELVLIKLPTAPAPIVPVPFVAVNVPPLKVNPTAESSHPVAPAEIDPVLAWVNVPPLKVNNPVDEISAPTPLVTGPLLEFALVPELLRLIAPATSMEAPVPEPEIVPLLLLVLDRVAPPLMFNALEKLISAPLPPAIVAVPVFELLTIPPLPVMPGLSK